MRHAATANLQPQVHSVVVMTVVAITNCCGERAGQIHLGRELAAEPRQQHHASNPRELPASMCGGHGSLSSVVTPVERHG